MSRWGNELRCVHTIFLAGSHLPAVRLLGIVAAFALTQAVLGACRSVNVMWLRVVTVPDRRIAIRRAAGPIPQPDERCQPPRKTPRPRLHRHQRTRTRATVQAAQCGP